VRCGEVELQLTLTAKFLKRPFAAAVIGPFIGAYSKRVSADPPVTAADVTVVLIDGVAVDTSLMAAELLPIAPFTWVELTLGGEQLADGNARPPLVAPPPPAPVVAKQEESQQDWRVAAADMFALTDEDLSGWVLEEPERRVEDSVADRAVGNSSAAALAAQVAEATFSIKTSTTASSRVCVYFPQPAASKPLPAGGMPLILIAHPANCHARHPWVLWQAWRLVVHRQCVVCVIDHLPRHGVRAPDGGSAASSRHAAWPAKFLADGAANQSWGEEQWTGTLGRMSTEWRYALDIMLAATQPTGGGAASARAAPSACKRGGPASGAAEGPCPLRGAQLARQETQTTTGRPWSNDCR